MEVFRDKERSLAYRSAATTRAEPMEQQGSHMWASYHCVDSKLFLEDLSRVLVPVVGLGADACTDRTELRQAVK